MIPNIYESPSESLNLQLQKPGFLREERVKTPQGCWGKKKIKPVKSSAFPGSCRTSGLFKVKGGMNWGGEERTGNWNQSLLNSSKRTLQADWAAGSSSGLEGLNNAGSSNSSFSSLEVRRRDRTGAQFACI